MPRSCTICDSPLIATVTALLDSGMPGTRIADDLGLSYEALKRHARNRHRRPAASVATAPTKATLSGPESPREVFEAAFGVAPMEWQYGYLDETLPTVVRKGRQVGATQSAAGLAIWTARSRAGADAVIISPSMRQSSEITVRARIGLDNLGDKLVQDSAGLIRLKNGSRIVSLPGNSRGIRGYAPMLVVVDEAAWVADDTWTAARPLVAASGGRLIVQSTPGYPTGFFHSLATDTPDGWVRLLVRSTDVATIDPEFLAREQAEMSPALFRQEYMAEFQSTDDIAGALFHPDDIDKAFAGGVGIPSLLNPRREA